ncbi:MAG: hypothetical protein ABFD61_01115 [Chloroherpetonaceae bacterium]
MSLTTIAVDLMSICENIGGSPPEFHSYIEKFDPLAFAGISGLDLSTISATEYATIETNLSDNGVPAEAIALLEKIKNIIITAEI